LPNGYTTSFFSAAGHGLPAWDNSFYKAVISGSGVVRRQYIFCFKRGFVINSLLEKLFDGQAIAKHYKLCKKKSSADYAGFLYGADGVFSF
jgi:hypothetical protein